MPLKTSGGVLSREPYSVLVAGGSSNEACQSLVNLALDAGGEDNISVVLARYRFPPPAW